jgi:hypothetical protein
MTANLSMMSMASDGTIWAVDTSQNALRWTQGGKLVPGGNRPMAKISVRSASQIWGVDNTGQPVSLQVSPGLNTWQNMATATLNTISGATDGTVWGTDRNNKPARWNGKGWDTMPGQATQVSVASKSIIWSVDPSGNPQSWNGSGWQAAVPLGQPIKSLAVGSDGYVWAVGGNDHLLYMFESSGWHATDWGPLDQIDCADAYHLAGVTPVHRDPASGQVNEPWFSNYGPLRAPVAKPDFHTPWKIQGLDIGSAPALATLGSKLFCAFTSNDSRMALYASDSTGGQTWTVPARDCGGMQMSTAVMAAVLNNKIYCVYAAPDLQNPALCMTCSSDGVRWASPQRFPNIQIAASFLPVGGPALTAFNGKLWCAFRAAGLDSSLFITNSDGQMNSGSWATPWRASGSGSAQMLISGRPALAAFMNQLVCVFQANDQSGNMYFTTSTDGVNWTPAQQVADIKMGSDPALAVFQKRLYCAYQGGQSYSGPLCLTSSNDGQGWTAEVQYSGFTTNAGPGLAVMGGRLYAAWQGDKNLLSVSMATMVGA